MKSINHFSIMSDSEKFGEVQTELI